jgi:hypothetical protein
LCKGRKEAYYDDDFWADHDEQCHGDIDALVDEPEYMEGFKWFCCGELGDDEGCKATKHKSGSNIIVKKPTRHAPVILSRKRKAEKEVERPVYKRCQK